MSHLTTSMHVEDAHRLMTPALLVCIDSVRHNISETIRLFNGDPNRWRPHIKTAKLAAVMNEYLKAGVKHFKCATTLELLTLCQLQAPDVLVAFPCIGPTCQRVCQIARKYPNTKISTLIDEIDEIDRWKSSSIGLFVDINSGMNRTGVEQFDIDRILNITKSIIDSNQSFRGLHYYDGHLGKFDDLTIRQQHASTGYQQLTQICQSLKDQSIKIPEIITAGTPAFPCAIPFLNHFDQFTSICRLSPGTIVYGDCRSQQQIGDLANFHNAVFVLATAISLPTDSIVTLDAGHKVVSVDSGVPSCVIVGRSDLIPNAPTEEHLPVSITDQSKRPKRGDLFYLIPKHVCPTVNNFDHAIMIDHQGKIIGFESVTSRGHENPLILEID